MTDAQTFADQTPAEVSPVRRRRKRWPWVLLVVLVIFIGLLVAADRVAASVASGKVADKLTNKNPFVGRPSVTLHGFPFITQAVGGTYDDIEVNGQGRPVGKLGAVHVDARLHGVHISLSDVRNHVDRVPVDRGVVTISVPLAAVANASGIEGLTLTSSGDVITARGPATIPGLGKVTVSASGRLVISSAGAITVDLTSFKGVGVTLPASARSAALAALGLVVPVDNLPFKSVATSVKVKTGIVYVSGSAHDFVLQ